VRPEKSLVLFENEGKKFYDVIYCNSQKYMPTVIELRDVAVIEKVIDSLRKRLPFDI